MAMHKRVSPLGLTIPAARKRSCNQVLHMHVHIYYIVCLLPRGSPDYIHREQYRNARSRFAPGIRPILRPPARPPDTHYQQKCSLLIKKCILQRGRTEDAEYRMNSRGVSAKEIDCFFIASLLNCPIDDSILTSLDFCHSSKHPCPFD
jgi:hypothetical protein